MSTLPRHPNLLRREDALLVVIDMQEPFLSVIHERQRLLSNVHLLIQGAQALGVPILCSLQNAGRLGGLTPEIAEYLSSDVSAPIDKMAFSCAGSPEFMHRLQEVGRRQIILCGVETHICVAQTALDLAQQGYQVHAAADAVSARTLEKHKLGMERIRDSRILPCSAEAAVYELLGTAGAAEFKAILSLVK